MHWLSWAIYQNNFWYAFSSYFFHKNVLYLKLYTKFQYQTYFPSKYIKQYVFKLLLSQLMAPQTLPIFSSSDQQEEKEGKREIQKFEYLENKKSLLDDIKSIFDIF